jgi:hypothetical protein
MSLITKSLETGPRVTKREDVLQSTDLPFMRKLVRGDELKLHNEIKAKKQKPEVKDDKVKTNEKT